MSPSIPRCSGASDSNLERLGAPRPVIVHAPGKEGFHLADRHNTVAAVDDMERLIEAWVPVVRAIALREQAEG